MANNLGSKRVVVGASYGLRDWLAQRITAVLMALFTLAIVVRLVLEVFTIVWLVACTGWAIQVLWRL